MGRLFGSDCPDHSGPWRGQDYGGETVSKAETLGSLKRDRGSGREGKASASYSGSRNSTVVGELGSTVEKQQEEGREDKDPGIIAPHQSAVSCGALYSASSLES